MAATYLPYPHWLNPGDNAWQLTAATLVGLMSVPGLVVLYGGVMQKRWSVTSMMMSFIAFALVLIAWVLGGFEMAFGHPLHIFGAHHGFFANMIGIPRDILGHVGEQGQATIPLITTGPPFHFPTSTLAYFQFVFAAITPILMLGSVLGRFNFKAWLPFVVLWSAIVYTVDAFTIWGGGWFAQHGALDYSGGYVIHLSAGISGFVAITPAAGYVNGWGAMAIGVIGSTVVYFALNYLSRLQPFRRVDDTLGVVYTHGFAGLAGGLLVGVFADPHMIIYPGQGNTA